MRLPDRSSGSASPRFSRHSRSRAASSAPMMIRASEPPIKTRRSVLDPVNISVLMTSSICEIGVCSILRHMRRLIAYDIKHSMMRLIVSNLKRHQRANSSGSGASPVERRRTRSTIASECCDHSPGGTDRRGNGNDCRQRRCRSSGARSEASSSSTRTVAALAYVYASRRKEKPANKTSPIGEWARGSDLAKRSQFLEC